MTCSELKDAVEDREPIVILDRHDLTTVVARGVAEIRDYDPLDDPFGRGEGDKSYWFVPDDPDEEPWQINEVSNWIELERCTQ